MLLSSIGSSPADSISPVGCGPSPKSSVLEGLVNITVLAMASRISSNPSSELTCRICQRGSKMSSSSSNCRGPYVKDSKQKRLVNSPSVLGVGTSLSPWKLNSAVVLKPSCIPFVSFGRRRTFRSSDMVSSSLT